MNPGAFWISGNKTHCYKFKGGAESNIADYKLFFGDLIEETFQYKLERLKHPEYKSTNSADCPHIVKDINESVCLV